MEANSALRSMSAGALHAHTQPISIEGNTTFAHNTAKEDGGESDWTPHTIGNINYIREGWNLICKRSVGEDDCLKRTGTVRAAAAPAQPLLA